MARTTSEKSWRGGVAVGAGAAVLLAALVTAAAGGTDNPPDDTVGTIEGDAIARIDGKPTQHDAAAVARYARAMIVRCPIVKK